MTARLERNGGYPGSYSGRRHPGEGYAVRSQAYQGPTEADRQALVETNAAAIESCNGLAPGVTDLPTERIICARHALLTDKEPTVAH